MSSESDAKTAVRSACGLRARRSAEKRSGASSVNAVVASEIASMLRPSSGLAATAGEERHDWARSKAFEDGTSTTINAGDSYLVDKPHLPEIIGDETVIMHEFSQQVKKVLDSMKD